MEIAGYIASLFIGISLGLIGGGGSILTVPVLIYLFHISPATAVSYSLFIVGVTSFTGAMNSSRKGLVNYKTALLFGAASTTTVFLARKFIVPLLPVVLFRHGAVEITYAMFVMVVFAMLMLAASIAMIRSKTTTAKKETKQRPLTLVAYGVLIGLVTGFLGAGGGFLLIPALVILMTLPMKEAIGTSLLIIALNSAIGFMGDVGSYPVNWKLITTISAIAIAGVFTGNYFNHKVDSNKLKKGFGWFVLAMGTYILFKETIL